MFQTTWSGIFGGKKTLALGNNRVLLQRKRRWTTHLQLGHRVTTMASTHNPTPCTWYRVYGSPHDSPSEAKRKRNNSRKRECDGTWRVHVANAGGTPMFEEAGHWCVTGIYAYGSANPATLCSLAIMLTSCAGIHRWVVGTRCNRKRTNWCVQNWESVSSHTKAWDCRHGSL